MIIAVISKNTFSFLMGGLKRLAKYSNAKKVFRKGGKVNMREGQREGVGIWTSHHNHFLDQPYQTQVTKHPLEPIL